MARAMHMHDLIMISISIHVHILTTFCAAACMHAHMLAPPWHPMPAKNKTRRARAAVSRAVPFISIPPIPSPYMEVVKTHP